METFPAYYEGDTTYDLQGRVSTGFLPDVGPREGWDFVRSAWKLDRRCRELPQGRPWDHPESAHLDRITLGDWLDQHTSTTFSASVYRLITRAIMAGYPERISLLWFLWYLRSAGGLLPLILNDGGAQDTRFEGGSQLVSIRMAEELGDRVHLGRPVTRIEDRGARLRVHTADGPLEAARVIVAMMPADTLRIRFEPDLPPQRRELATGWARLGRLPIVKTSVLYATPFWRAAGLNGAMQSDRSPLQLVFDNSPPDGSIGILSCFLSVTESPGFGARRTREARVIDELARYFGPQARKPTGYVEKDWATDPWSTGCITPLTPGVLTRAGPALRTPTGRIHWAGTETSATWCGFMDGAVRSGERAAAEVASAIAASPDQS